MTTTILVHNSHRKVRVLTEDRIWDPVKKALSDDWTKATSVDLDPGALYQTYCTDTRRVTIIEPEL